MQVIRDEIQYGKQLEKLVSGWEVGPMWADPHIRCACKVKMEQIQQRSTEKNLYNFKPLHAK
jgi:hypothetical protein